MAGDNLLEATPVVHEVFDDTPFDYAVVGGLVTDALLSDGAVIDAANKSVYIDEETHISTIRPNGTMKDLDMLAFTRDTVAVRESLQQMRRALVDQFPLTSISLSGYDTEHADRAPQFVTRTVVEGDDTLALSLGALRQSIPRTDLEESWQLYFRDSTMAILHPGAHLMSYKIRSVTGIRPKDREKVGRLEGVVRESIPEEAMRQFDTWEQFAASIESHYSFLAGIQNPTAHRLLMSLGRAGLGMVERSPRLVAWAQADASLAAKAARAVLMRSKPGMHVIR